MDSRKQVQHKHMVQTVTVMEGNNMSTVITHEQTHPHFNTPHQQDRLTQIQLVNMIQYTHLNISRCTSTCGTNNAGHVDIQSADSAQSWSGFGDVLPLLSSDPLKPSGWTRRPFPVSGDVWLCWRSLTEFVSQQLLCCLGSMKLNMSTVETSPVTRIQQQPIMSKWLSPAARPPACKHTPPF